MIQGLASANYPEYEAKAWHLTLIIFAMLIVQALMNMYAFPLIPWIELCAGVLHVSLFVIFLVVFVALAPRHSAEFVFLRTQSWSGWNSDFASWNIGLLTPVWGFVGSSYPFSSPSLRVGVSVNYRVIIDFAGFDGAVHMSEETRQARQAVPRSIFYTVVTNGILAYAMVICILFTMGSVEEAQQQSFPIIQICQQATGSLKVATAMVCGLLVISLSVTLASIASASRLTWAWARDGALPRWFAYVSLFVALLIRFYPLRTLIPNSILFSQPQPQRRSRTTTAE